MRLSSGLGQCTLYRQINREHFNPKRLPIHRAYNNIRIFKANYTSTRFANPIAAAAAAV